MREGENCLDVDAAMPPVGSRSMYWISLASWPNVYDRLRRAAIADDVDEAEDKSYIDTVGDVVNEARSRQ